MATTFAKRKFQTFSLKTDKEMKGDTPIIIGNFLKIIDDETGKQVFPQYFKVEIETDEIATITMKFPVSDVDVEGILEGSENDGNL